MSLTLIGSATSPYVRRLRLYLQDAPYTFEPLNILDAEGDARLTKISPIKRIPLLLIDNNPLFESRVIFSYIQKRFGRHELSLDEENLISAADALLDQLIQIYLMRRFDHPVDLSNAYFARFASRKKETLQFLASAVSLGKLHNWDYPAMSLYTLLDWALFREMLTKEEVPQALHKFLAEHHGQPEVAGTDPRTLA